MKRWQTRGPLIAAMLLLGAPAGAQQAALTPEQTSLKAHVQFLAADSLRGREAGTRDYDVAADYVAARMLAMGLKPGGADGGWFQPFRLVSYRPAEPASWTLTRGGAAVPFAFGKDFINAPVADQADFAASGEIVFVGYGIVDAQEARDDYKGLDVAGKIVAILAGTPTGLPSDIDAHYGDDDQKARLAAAHGARAVVILESAARRKDYTFDMVVPAYAYPRTTWAPIEGPAHDPAGGAPVIGYVSQAGAAKLFDGGALRWSAVQAAEASGGRMPRGALAGTLAVAGRTRSSVRETRNVVGVIEGSDPALRHEYVVLSAHLDHVGVGSAVKGDRIYNGAMDNAIGVAMILDVARSIRESGRRPRRSLLIVALGAEEKGLIGSGYFAALPTVPKSAIVADINLDMPILTYPLVDLVVLGGGRSTLGPAVAAAARGEGLAVVPDPAPEEAFFVRSDHYSFVQAGIPAVSIDTGPGGTGAVAARAFLDEHYHEPSDQIDLPFDWTSAVKFKRVALATALAVADADERPRWNKGDFFGQMFGGNAGHPSR
ncbi:M28 family peptidase [Sphingomonas sp. RS6]